MSESTLAITLTDIRDAMSKYLGYDPDYDNDSSDEQAEIDSLIKRGLRQFYWPPRLNDRSHQWSFLKPVTTVYLWGTETSTLNNAPVYDESTYSTVTVDDAIFYDTAVGKSVTIDTTDYTIYSVTSTTVCVVLGDASGHADETAVTLTADGDYRLPDDFACLEGTFRFDAASGYAPPILVGESFIRQRRTECESTGTPLYVAVRPQSTTNASGQRFELCAYPTPDTAYTLSYRYSVLPNALVETTNEYPYGGAQHGQTILESCLAVAEQQVTESQGIHTALFMQHLATSIDMDVRLNTPDRFRTGLPDQPYRARRGTITATYDDTAP